MEEEDVLPEATGSTKLRQEEVSRGRRKRQKEDDIRPEKRGHSPTVSQRTQKPEGFYSEDLNEVQQEEDKLQAPDKWQRISGMVFCGGSLEINLWEAKLSQVPVLNTKGADVAYLWSRYEKPRC